MLCHQLNHEITGLGISGRNIERCRGAPVGDILHLDMAPDKKRPQSPQRIELRDTLIDIRDVISILNNPLVVHRGFP